jgi:hypothetical protein
MLKRRPGLLAVLSAIAATAGLSLVAAPAGYAAAPLGLHPAGPAAAMCVQASPGNGGCVRTTGSKDNSAVWA